jgi:hypothetical protein
VITQRFDQDLAAAVELPSKNAMRTVGLVEGPPTILDDGAEVLGRVLVFEALNPVAVRAREEKPDHDVGEASIDEIVDDRS